MHTYSLRKSYNSRFMITTHYFQKLYKLNEIVEIKDKEYFNKEEYGYLYIFPQFKLFIPCKEILNKFYLSDKFIEKMLFSARIEEVIDSYEFLSINNTCNKMHRSSNILKLICNKNISKKTIKFLSRILFDKRIKEIYDYHYFQKVINSNEQIKSYFPYIGTLIINANISTYDNIHIVENFTTTIPNYFSHIFYATNKNTPISAYKTIELKHYYSNYITNDKYETFHKKVIESLSKDYSFKLISYAIDQNILDYSTTLIYAKSSYYIYFSYSLIEYKQERILIIYFSNEDYLNRNYIFRNFNVNDVDEFIRKISHLINKGQTNYDEIKKYVKEYYEINFYPFNIPLSFFFTDRDKVLDLIEYLTNFLNNDFQKNINYFTLHRNYKYEDKDFY
jgi:hypothetical protein